MAAVVKCDACNRVVPYTKAYHVRAYPLQSATTYNSSNVKLRIDMCDACLKRCQAVMKNGGEQSDAD